MTIRTVKPGDLTSQTSGSSRFLNKLIRAANRRDEHRQNTDNTGYVSAITGLAERYSAGADPNPEGFVFGGRTTLLESDYLTPERWVTQGADGLNNLSFFDNQRGQFAVAAGDLRDSEPGRMYLQGLFPALVWIRHYKHRFADIEIGISATAFLSVLESCANGAARIMDVEIPHHVYADEADRINETSYTVTSDDIATEKVFGQKRSGAVPTDNPDRYYKATGSPGSVVWIETAVRCLLEKPSVAPIGIQYGEQLNVEGAPSTAPRSISLDFDFGDEEILKSEPDGGNFRIKTLSPKGETEFMIHVTVEFSINANPTSGMASVTLSMFGGTIGIENETFGFDSSYSGYNLITLRSSGLHTFDHLGKFIFVSIAGNASIQVLRATIHAHPCRKIY